MKENLNREELSAAISETRKSFDTDNPVVPFIEGDGIGIDLWPASQLVFDSAVKKAYNNQRKINWMEVLAGQKHLISKMIGCQITPLKCLINMELE